MNSSKRNPHLRRYRNLSMDVVLGLLADRGEESFFGGRDRRRRQQR